MDGKQNLHRRKIGQTLLVTIRSSRSLQNKKEANYNIIIGKIREILVLILGINEKY